MNTLRNLPAVDQILSSQDGQELVNQYGHTQVVQAIRSVLEDARQRHLNEGVNIPIQSAVILQSRELLRVKNKPTLVPIINATGVIIHTNLGRAPLSQEALEAVNNIAGGYSTLEFNLSDGGRGSRLVHAEEIFQQLLGVEAALVVNNNASAGL